MEKELENEEIIVNENNTACNENISMVELTFSKYFRVVNVVKRKLYENKNVYRHKYKLDL